MISCERFDNCKRAGIVPERVRRGYDSCRNKGVYTKGKRKGEKCYFVTFPELEDIETVNERILAGQTLGHALARARREARVLARARREARLNGVL